MEVEEYLEEADLLFEQAERLVQKEPEEGLRRFQTGVANLLQAFLTLKGIAAKGDLKKLFGRCLEVEAEFAAIADEIAYFLMPELAELDPEVLVDAANEVWDFVSGFLPE